MIENREAANADMYPAIPCLAGAASFRYSSLQLAYQKQIAAIVPTTGSRTQAVNANTGCGKPSY